jgi:hypothetical protein
MSQRYALVQDGIVSNIIVWDGDVATLTLPTGVMAVEDTDIVAVVGGTYADGVFDPPAPAPVPVPESVSPLQMRRALRLLSLKPTVDAFIATLDEETVEAWEYANEILRHNQLIAMAATGLGMTDEQVDDLFRLAATL